MDDLSLAPLFPLAREIPAGLNPGATVDCRRYLCGGQVLTWSGPVRRIFSPIHIRQAGADDLQPLELGSYPLMGEGEALAALNAAVAAYDGGLGPWPMLEPAARRACLAPLVAALREIREPVVRLLLWEIGKSQSEAEMEFSRALDYLEATLEAHAAGEQDGELLRRRGVLALPARAPLGVALCLGPSNNPFYETLTLLLPALLMGNCVIYKPPRLGVLLHDFLLQTLIGLLPPGVVNIIYGEGEDLLPPLMRSGRIDLLAFIGSRRVADQLRRLHPDPGHLRCLLGMEAKNAAIVLADADLEQAVAECLLGALAFNGQRCTALKMLLVEEAIREPFLERLTAAVAALPAGMPWLPGVRITPLPEMARVDFLVELLADAQAQGARILNPGGGRRCRTFMTPALIYPVSKEMRLYHEEQFGPLVPVAGFADPREAVDYVKKSEFGQQVSIFGQDRDRLVALARPLLNLVGRVNINGKCRRGPDSLPFTGRKNSAEGTVSVSEALKACSIETMIAAREGEEHRELLTATPLRNLFFQ